MNSNNKNNNLYYVHYFRFGLYIKTFRNLTFDEAYKMCVPEESNAVYNNYWHVMLKGYVQNKIENSNEKIQVSFEENPNNINKHLQEYYIEKQN